MAIYHFRMKKSTRKGKRLSAVAHLKYINREDRYKNKEDLLLKETKNLPKEFRNIEDFWKNCELHERANANLFRELEIALPKELTGEENHKLVKAFAAHIFGDEYVYNYAIHQPKDYGGDPQPHVHIMFCERRLDGIDRPKEQFFKQHYSFAPAKSGAKKNVYWTKKEALKNMREDWETFLNFELEKRGISKVSSKSLKDQKRDAENNRDYEKAKELDRTPISIEGEILYKNEKKLTESEQLEKDIFNSKRVLKKGSEYYNYLIKKIKKIQSDLKKFSKEEYEILEKIRELDRKINTVKNKTDNEKIENTVYNLMSNKEYYNLLNDNKVIDRKLKFEKEKNKIVQLNIRKKMNTEKIEKIKRDIINNPKKKYIFTKRKENIIYKYEQKIKNLEAEKKAYLKEISKKYKDYDEVSTHLYSKKHLQHIFNEKGMKEITKIENEFSKLLKILENDPEIISEESRIKNKISRGEYKEIISEIEQIKIDTEFLKKELEKENTGKYYYRELLEEKEELLKIKEERLLEIEKEIRPKYRKEISKKTDSRLQEKVRTEEILDTIQKVKSLNKVLKKNQEAVKKIPSVKKRRNLKINLNSGKKSDEIRGNFTLKDLEDLERYEE